MKIVVDPLLPSSIAVTFFGPTTSVEFYREKYRVGINNWNADDDIYRNLLKIFGIKIVVNSNVFSTNFFNIIFVLPEMVAFPQKPLDGSDTSEQTQCSICYLYRLNGQIPIITCDNTKCHLVFHKTCLKEWFSIICDSKTFLTVTSGNCPSCKEVRIGRKQVIMHICFVCLIQ